MDQKKNIGIVTTWFERGAAYVSKQYMEVMQQQYNVYIYARSGEFYAQGDPEWDLPNVYWSKKINSPFTVTVIDEKEFKGWIEKNNIEAILFNEQHWWLPLLWCRELGVKTMAYIDYYNENTVPLFGIYDVLICNTKKHLQAFNWHPGASYIPWGTNVDLFKPDEKQERSDKLVFFHSCGMNPKRKGTDLLIKALGHIKNENYKLIIHTQTSLLSFFPELEHEINNWVTTGKLEIIEKTVNAPGLYTLGDVYVYPSRLEGIGLTVVEAIASGLGVIVPDCGPMNEFVHPDFGSTVAIEKYFSRIDGYYWPQNEVEIVQLAFEMDRFIGRKTEIADLKKRARNYAVNELNWQNNASSINGIIESMLQKSYTESKSNCNTQIQKFENTGLRKFNKYYLKFPYIFNLLLTKR